MLDETTGFVHLSRREQLCLLEFLPYQTRISAITSLRALPAPAQSAPPHPESPKRIACS